jgi:hypothetical protein
MEDITPTNTAFSGTSYASSSILLSVALPEPKFINRLTWSEFIQVLGNTQNPYLPL